jgi:cytochrome P450 family 135
VQAALLYRHGSRFLAACQRRYGSVFTLRIVSIGTLVYLADPADIKTVFTGNLYVIDKNHEVLKLPVG